MTNQEKAQAYFMRLEGATYQEIADHFGITKSWAQRLFSFMETPSERATKKCVYPNLASWMVESRLNFNGVAKVTGLSAQTIITTFEGRSHPTKYTIGRILASTGMTYDVAFARGEVEP